MNTSTEEILVVGHHNPDTDAICSALAYADLYARLNSVAAVPCYLDDIGPETTWLLQYLDLPEPRPITDVYWRAADAMVRDAPSIRPDTTVREAGLIMRDQELGALPVLDGRRLAGVMPRDLLADRYLELLQLSMRLDQRLLPEIRRVLNAVQLAGATDGELDGQVWVGTFSPDVARASVEPGDIVIIEDDGELQYTVVDAGAGCLIVARDAPIRDDVRELARLRGTVVLRTSYNSLAVAALLEQSAPVERVMLREPMVVRSDDLLTDAQQHFRRSRLASLPVIDEDRVYLGLLLRRALVPQERRRVILTDHNHVGQAAAGVGESEIVAIIDHHNLGGLQTLQPLTMQIEPVGCTCTLIAEGYRRANITPQRQIAAAMLAAILSDTVQFRSPTTTARDRDAATWLAVVSGESIDQLAHSLFRARLPVPTPPPEWWVSRDWKVYTFGDTRIGIAQMELVDIDDVMPPLDDLRRELAEHARREALTTAFLMLTDIFEQASLFIAANDVGEQIAQRAFGTPFANHRLLLPKVMSRKKQVVPPIAAALAT